MYSFYKHNLIIEKYSFLKEKKRKSYKIPTSDYKASCSQVVLRCKYCTRVYKRAKISALPGAKKENF